ncbi:hypothetical protein PIROE2DRAFT_4401, partial [Piromyces sp. E2]
IENSILVNDSINEDESSVNDQMDIPNEDNKQTSQNDNNLLEIPQNNNDLPDSSIADITIVKSNEIDDIINVSVGTVKDLVTDIEQDSKLNETDNIETVNQPLFEIGKEKLTTESEKLPINEEDIDDDDTDEEQPLEFLSDHEQQIENETKVLPEMVNEGIHEDVAEKPNEILSNNKESVEIESEIAMHENEEDLEEPIEYIIDNEDEEPIEYINDNENAVKEHTECIDKNEKIDDPSILFNDGTENLINNELIDGNIEDHIIIEEEDSIVGNAIEEALENKSFVIQEHPFMDEPYANDLSFSFDGHAAFHEAMKIFEEDTPLETIKEEDEEENAINIPVDNEVDNEEQLKMEVINEDINDNNNINEDKILEMIENNINEPNDIKMNDMIVHTIIHENQDIINSLLPLPNDELLSPVKSEIVDDENEHKECDIKQEPIIENDNKKDTHEIINERQIEISNKENTKKESNEVNVENKVVQKKKVIKKKELRSSMEKPKNIVYEQTNKPKTKTINNSNKSLVLPTRNLIPTINKVDHFITNRNCVKAFTSTSLKQNVISTRPIEVTVSFSDFDKNIHSKSLPKGRSVPKIKAKTIAKPIKKPTPKKSTLVYGPNVKPLSLSKQIKNSTQKSITKTNKNSIISKPRRKIEYN